MSYQPMLIASRPPRVLLLAFVLVLSALLPSPVAAQVTPLAGSDCTSLGIPCTGTDTASSLVNVVLRIINIILTFAAVIALAVIVWAGITYIMSLGDDKKVGTAKHMILYAIIGLIIIGLSAIIVNVVVNLFR